MKIDYDGINSLLNEEQNRYESRLITVIIEAMNDGSISKAQISYRWEICNVCSGSGSHSNRLGVINVDDWDNDELDDYFAGRYDALCERCNGSGKVRLLDEDALPEDVVKFINEYRSDYYDCLDERRSEMMWGA